MNEPILLKKYGNRRLYDCSRSAYVTLADVEKMLQDGNDIRVVDSKTGDDLTRSVLIQIILERDDSQSVLPSSFLKQVVRFSNSPLKEHFTKALLNYLNVFMQSQNAISAQMAENTSNYFQQGGFLNPFAFFAPPGPPRPQYNSPRGHTTSLGTEEYWSDPRVEPDAPGELDVIKEELAKTQALVREMIEGQQEASKKVESRAPKKRAKTQAKRAAPKKKPLAKKKAKRSKI